MSPLAATAPASAAEASYPVKWTSNGIYPRSSAALLQSNKSGAAVPNGTRIVISCSVVGESVKSPVATSSMWGRTPEGTFFPEAFLETGANGFPGVPSCTSAPKLPTWTQEQIAPRVGYIPQGAQEWARQNYNTFSKKYTSNCTWFVSNALWAGGLARTGNWTDSGANPANAANRTKPFGPTKAATTADYLKNELVGSGVGSLEQVDINTAVIPGAKVGDLVFYDWDPNGKADGAVDHVVIITGFVDGAPVVTGQTNNVLDQRWQYTAKQKLITSTKKVVNAYIMRITG